MVTGILGGRGTLSITWFLLFISKIPFVLHDLLQLESKSHGEMGDIWQGKWMCFANAPKQIDDDNNMWEKNMIFFLRDWSFCVPNWIRWIGFRISCSFLLLVWFETTVGVCHKARGWTSSLELLIWIGVKRCTLSFWCLCSRRNRPQTAQIFWLVNDDSGLEEYNMILMCCLFTLDVVKKTLPEIRILLVPSSRCHYNSFLLNICIISSQRFVHATEGCHVSEIVFLSTGCIRGGSCNSVHWTWAIHRPGLQDCCLV